MQFPKAILLWSLVFSVTVAVAQSDTLLLDRFDKVVIGQKIKVTLQKGDTNQIRYSMTGIDEDELIIRQSGRKLEVFLDKARNLERRRTSYENGYKHKEDWYEEGWTEVTITFRELEKVILKGEEDVAILGDISTDNFKLKAYGDMDIYVENLQAERMKAKLYGENDLTIGSGSVALQKYKLFGENTIEAENTKSYVVQSTHFGETMMNVDAEQIRFTVFGELDIHCKPGTHIRKTLVLGESDITMW